MSEMKKQDKPKPSWVFIVAAAPQEGEVQVLMGGLSGCSGGKADENLEGKGEREKSLGP